MGEIVFFYFMLTLAGVLVMHEPLIRHEGTQFATLKWVLVLFFVSLFAWWYVVFLNPGRLCMMFKMNYFEALEYQGRVLSTAIVKLEEKKKQKTLKHDNQKS